MAMYEKHTLPLDIRVYWIISTPCQCCMDSIFIEQIRLNDSSVLFVTNCDIPIDAIEESINPILSIIIYMSQTLDKRFPLRLSKTYPVRMIHIPSSLSFQFSTYELHFSLYRSSLFLQVHNGLLREYAHISVWLSSHRCFRSRRVIHPPCDPPQ